MSVRVIKDKCVGCGACEAGCPVGAIDVSSSVAVISDACISCGSCINACPCEAIEGDTVEKKEVSIADYHGVWVFAEQRDGVLMGTGAEL